MIKRLQNFFQKDTISLVFMGGSVTEGFPHDARVTMPYPEIIRTKLSALFPDKKIVVHNFGKSGEQSSRALMTSEILLNQTQEQIIFLEYSLTDDFNQTAVKVYESLLRKLLTFRCRPVVIPVILPTARVSSVGKYMIEISRHYQLPYLDVASYINNLIAHGKLLWEEYSFDSVHPLQYGQEQIADYIIHRLSEFLHADTTENTAYRLPSKRFLGSPYEDLKVMSIDADTTFPLTLELDCSTLWLSYLQHSESFMGNVQIYVDKQLLCNLHGKSFYCWYYPVQLKLFEQKERKKHTITFQMAPGDENKKFILEYLGIC